MKVAITGDRSWGGSRYWEIYRPLAKLSPATDLVILGDATGVDAMALRACRELGLPYVKEEAEWARYRMAAGPIRNTAMLDHQPDQVWWFHDDLANSRGTKDMVAKAMVRKIPLMGPDDLRA